MKMRTGRTKIIATLGPATTQPETLRALVDAGMSVARLNLAHGAPDEIAGWVGLIRKASQTAGEPVAVMADLSGPRIRLGEVSPGSLLIEGNRLTLDASPSPGGSDRASISHFADVVKAVRPGHRLLIADGTLQLDAEEVTSERIVTRVVVGGPLGSNKGVNFPDSSLSMPALTAKDRTDLRAALDAGVDYVALSFVGASEDVELLRSEIAAAGYDAPIVAKIERADAVRDIERIAGVSDALMVARGDLALEVGAAQVPLLQKRIIALANRAGLPVITATQMLDSMIRNPNPTRAETSDVANAILDGTDAVMLSGETAIGRYPVRAVEEMASIAREAETALRFGRAPHGEMPSGSPVATAVAHSAVEIATRLDVAAVAAATTTGRTARMVARFRPRMPLIGLTRDPGVSRRLALVWGVRPIVVDAYDSTEEMVRITSMTLQALGVARDGDRFVVISGQPIGRPGSTNMVQVRRVGDEEPQPSTN